MDEWVFFDYVQDDDTRCTGGMPEKATNKLDQVLRGLAGLSAGKDRLVPCIWIKDLKGEANKGLLELRFKSERVQWRPICCYGPGEHEFTILFVAREIGWMFIPRKTEEIARKRRDQVRVRKARLREHANEE